MKKSDEYLSYFRPAEVIVHKGESMESAARRLRRICAKENIYEDTRKKIQFIPKGERKRIKHFNEIERRKKLGRKRKDFEKKFQNE